MNFNSADSSNSPKSTFLAALCVFGFSCSSPVHDAYDSLNVISPGCGPILSDSQIPVKVTQLYDGSTSYFAEDSNPYRKCRVVIGPKSDEQNSMLVDYYTEQTGEGVSDSCLIESDSVSCNRAAPVNDERVMLFAKTVSGLVRCWLPLPSASATSSAATTDMSASVPSGAGL